MEINITKFFKEATPCDYSASVMERGENAGKETWSAAVAAAPEFNLLDTEEKREAFRKHAREFGAWSDEEIGAWSNDELTALFIQMISADMREGGLDTAEPDWEKYESDSQAGQVAGRVFKGVDDEIYYYAGT